MKVGTGLAAGKIKLNALQLSKWKTLNASIARRDPATALFLLDTGYHLVPGEFPQGANENRVYSSPAKSVKLLLRLDGPASSGSTYRFQIASAPSSASLVPPYAGWQRPTDLRFEEDLKLLVRAQPLSPDDKSRTEAPFGTGGPGDPPVKVSPSAKYGYFEHAIPAGTIRSGSSIFVRVVPYSGTGRGSKALGPASNWVHFSVVGSEEEQAKWSSDKVAKAALLKAQAEAEKQKKEIAAEIEGTRSALTKSFEIRLLSYIPPKFADDQDAALYFRASRPVNFQGGGVAFNIPIGSDYYLTQVKTLLNADKSWQQELWDLATAELNLVSNAYTQAKVSAASTIASGFNKVGVPVSQEMVMIGLNAALAYCGIPPTIPNIDQIYGKGIDYLASVAADAAIEASTGVAIKDLGLNETATTLVADKARQPAVEGMKSLLMSITQPAPFQPDVPETWGRPSPFFRKRPAMMYLEIRRKAGSPEVSGQTWQSLRLFFPGEFETTDLELPRKIGDKVRVPVALATTEDPSNWSIVATMPEKNLDPWAKVGQPYYSERGTVLMSLISTHRLSKTGISFSINWMPISFSPAYVNGIALPANHAPFPSQAIEGPVVNAPSNYFGKVYWSPVP